MKLNNQELIEITGGAISASLINSLARGITSLLDLGRAIGSAIRRITSKKICSL